MSCRGFAAVVFFGLAGAVCSGCASPGDINCPDWHASMLRAGRFDARCPVCGLGEHWLGVCGGPVVDDALAKQLRHGDAEKAVRAKYPRMQRERTPILDSLASHHLCELVRLRDDGGRGALVGLLMSETPTEFWVTSGSQWNPWIGISGAPRLPLCRVTVGDMADFALRCIYGRGVGWQVGQARTERERATKRWRRVVDEGEFPKTPLVPRKLVEVPEEVRRMLQQDGGGS